MVGNTAQSGDAEEDITSSWALGAAARFVKNSIDNRPRNKLDCNTKNHLQKVYTFLSWTMVLATIGAIINFNGEGSWQFSLPFVLAGFFLTNDVNAKICQFMLISMIFGQVIMYLLSKVGLIQPITTITLLLGAMLTLFSFRTAVTFVGHVRWLYLFGIFLAILKITLLGLFHSIWQITQYHNNIDSILYLYVELLIMCSFILYETRLIIEKFHRKHPNNKFPGLENLDYIDHSCDAVIDFIKIWRPFIQPILAVFYVLKCSIYLSYSSSRYLCAKIVKELRIIDENFINLSRKVDLFVNFTCLKIVESAMYIYMPLLDRFEKVYLSRKPTILKIHEDTKFFHEPALNLLRKCNKKICGIFGTLYSQWTLINIVVVIVYIYICVKYFSR